MEFFEREYGGTHYFRRAKTKQHLFEITTKESEWFVKNFHNEYYVLYHHPRYLPQNRNHIQSRDRNLVWLLWIAYTHDYYKFNRIPFPKEKGNQDYLNFLEKFKSYLSSCGLTWDEEDFK